MPEHSTAAVRNELIRKTSISEARALHLEQMLPGTWRRLIYRHGRARVFNCLRLNLTLGGAQRQLKDWRR